MYKVLPWKHTVLEQEDSQEDMTPFTQLGDYTYTCTHTSITDLVKPGCNYTDYECRTLWVMSKFLSVSLASSIYTPTDYAWSLFIGFHQKPTPAQAFLEFITLITNLKS